MDRNRLRFEFKPTETGGFPEWERNAVRNALLAGKHKVLRCIIEEVHRPASSPQKRYYYGTALPAVHAHFKKHGVHTIQEHTHEYLKRHVGGLIDYDAVPDSSGMYPTRSFSAEAENCVDVKEMSLFLERLWAWAAGIALEIKPPSERWE